MWSASGVKFNANNLDNYHMALQDGYILRTGDCTLLGAADNRCVISNRDVIVSVEIGMVCERAASLGPGSVDFSSIIQFGTYEGGVFTVNTEHPTLGTSVLIDFADSEVIAQADLQNVAFKPQLFAAGQNVAARLRFFVTGQVNTGGCQITYTSYMLMY